MASLELSEEGRNVRPRELEDEHRPRQRPRLLSAHDRQGLAARYSIMSSLMVQFDEKTKCFKDQYEGLLETGQGVAQFSSLLNGTRVDLERQSPVNAGNEESREAQVDQELHS